MTQKTKATAEQIGNSVKDFSIQEDGCDLLSECAPIAHQAHQEHDLVKNLNQYLLGNVYMDERQANSKPLTLKDEEERNIIR